MTTGDKVLALLGAKAACCSLLALAGTGALGGAFAWFMDRSLAWVVGAVLVVGIAAIIWRSGAAKSSPTEAAEAKAPDIGSTTIVSSARQRSGVS
jgi:hypothetical protein